jgi:hypothetical protein
MMHNVNKISFEIILKKIIRIYFSRNECKYQKNN